MGNKNNKMNVQYFNDITASEIKACCQTWKNEFSEMAVLAFVAEADAKKVPEIQNSVNEMGISLIGAIFPALVFESEFKKNGLLLICLAQEPLWYLQSDIPKEPEALQDSLNTIIHALSPDLDNADDSSLFLIFDAMLPNIATILDELYAELGSSVHYMGINAGSETFQPMPCLFDGQRIIENGMLAILIPQHDGAVLEHGYQKPKETIIATSTTENRIVSIDWKPAFEVYSERVQQQYGLEITRENFYEHAVHFPFGIIRADSEVLVRIPVLLDDDGALFCVGEIPENSILTLLDAPEAKSLHTVENLVEKMGEHPVNMLFYCAGRRMHLLDAADEELKELQSRMGNKINVGALSLGEIGSSHKGGYPLFHNATLVSLPLN